MKENTAEILLEESNIAIVSLPGRKFPGIVIQGDSLFVILSLLNELDGLVKEKQAREVIGELRQHIQWRIRKYEEVLYENEIPLPYNR